MEKLRVYLSCGALFVACTGLLMSAAMYGMTRTLCYNYETYTAQELVSMKLTKEECNKYQ
jgi:hypothetical protein